MATSNNRESPCLHCARVRDPKNCENKLCKEWQAWFIERWDAMRTVLRATAQGKGLPRNPISVGGTKYHHPDQIRKFLKTDPCQTCPWREGICLETCQTKKSWTEAKERLDELESGSQGETSQI